MLSTGMIRKAVSGLLNKKSFLALFLTVALVFSCVGSTTGGEQPGDNAFIGSPWAQHKR